MATQQQPLPSEKRQVRIELRSKDHDREIAREAKLEAEGLVPPFILRSYRRQAAVILNGASIIQITTGGRVTQHIELKDDCTIFRKGPYGSSSMDTATIHWKGLTAKDMLAKSRITVSGASGLQNQTLETFMWKKFSLTGLTLYRFTHAKRTYTWRSWMTYASDSPEDIEQYWELRCKESDEIVAETCRRTQKDGLKSIEGYPIRFSLHGTKMREIIVLTLHLLERLAPQ